MSLVKKIDTYTGWLSFVTDKIYKAQLNTHIKVNNELLSLYWESFTEKFTEKFTENHGVYEKQT